MPVKDAIESTVDKKPFLKELQAEINQAITDSWDFYRRNIRADETRYCVWDGQSEDGKKHEDDLGEKPFPWEGASDSQIRLADEIVNEHVRLLKNAFYRGKVQSVAVGSEDAPHSASMSRLLQWMFQTRMLQELRREVELLAQWRQHYGSAVVWLGWNKEERWEVQELSLDALKSLAQQQAAAGDDSVARILEALFDPLQEEVVIEMIQGLADWLTKSDARKIVKDLQTTGMAEFPKKYTFLNCPKWEACRTGIHVLFPSGTMEIQRARFIDKIEWVTETELRGRIGSDGYDAAFVEEALKHKGKMSRDDNLEWIRSGAMTERTRYLIDDYRELIELHHAYYKASERGATKIYCTIFHALVKDLWAKHEADVYDHAMYPVGLFVREWSQPTILQSRGISELSKTEQMEIKTQRDFRTDRASIAILPPLKHPLNRGKFELLLGPGCKVPERRPNEISWMQPPQYDPGSIEIERSVKMDVANYHGLIDANVVPTKLQLYQQDLVDTWLMEIAVSMVMTFQMMEQYMSEEEVERVVGNLSQNWKRSRQDIQRQYDVVITFDVRDLDTEYVIKKIDVLSAKLLPLDTQGVVDRAGIMKEAMASLDPRWADMYVKPAQAAADQEIDDEQNQYAKMFAGTEPSLKPAGQNFALRKQVLEGIFQANPDVQKRYQSDPIFQKMMKTRLDHFNFMLQQQQNAQIGRVGVRPALGITGVQ